MKNVTWINILLGIWLLIAPFALSSVGGSGAWSANDVILGILLIAASLWIVSAAAPTGAVWFEVLCGIWLVVAPFVLRYSGTGVKMTNDVISGIIAIVVAIIAMSGMRRTTTPTAHA